MSLFDNVFGNVRQTLEKTAKGAATRAGEAANTAREVGQNLSAQAQAQLQIKKLQLERSNKMRDLGEKTFAWYQSGTMIVAGPAPEDVHLLLREIDESSTRLRLEEAKLDDARRQAEMRGKGHESATYSVLPDANISNIVTSNPTSTDNFNTDNLNTENTMDTMTNQQSTSRTEKSTQKLSGFALQAEGVTMPGTGIITNPTPPVPNDDAPNAIPNVPAGDTSSSPIPDVDTPIPSPAPDGSGGLGGGTGIGVGTGISTPGSIPGGTF